MAKRSGREVLTLREAADFVRVSEKTLGDMARAGKVPCQKVGREWRFLRAAVERWLANEEPAPAVGEPDVQHALPSRGLDAPPAPTTPERAGFGDTAFTQNRDEPLHRWVPWIAGFSASFVGEVLDAAGGRDPADVIVLDPFAGVGTTLVEAMRRGHNAIGFEINPYAALVCRAKLQCARYDLALVQRTVRGLLDHMAQRGGSEPRSRPPAEFKSRAPFFSPKVERKVLHVLDFIDEQPAPWLQDLLRVAFGAVIVSISNYSYEPSLGRRASAGKDDVLDADVAGAVAGKLDEMARDIAQAQLHMASLGRAPRTDVHCESFLTCAGRVPSGSIDYLITSPPYLNNYHYVRNTRPHLHWLRLVESRSELKAMEEISFGKFWQTVRAGPRLDLEVQIDGLAEQIDLLRQRNPDKGVYGGTGWANYAVAYFNDCLRFCRAARTLMRPGGTLVVVLGNNILQGIEFQTDQHFASIAQTCGFELANIHRVRKKRTGSSIVNSSVRAGSPKLRVELYESALELTAPAARPHASAPVDDALPPQ